MEKFVIEMLNLSGRNTEVKITKFKTPHSQFLSKTFQLRLSTDRDYFDSDMVNFSLEHYLNFVDIKLIFWIFDDERSDSGFGSDGSWLLGRLVKERVQSYNLESNLNLSQNLSAVLLQLSAFLPNFCFKDFPFVHLRYCSTKLKFQSFWSRMVQYIITNLSLGDQGLKIKLLTNRILSRPNSYVDFSLIQDLTTKLDSDQRRMSIFE